MHNFSTYKVQWKKANKHKSERLLSPYLLSSQEIVSSLQFSYACVNLMGGLMFDVFWEAIERLER